PKDRDRTFVDAGMMVPTEQDPQIHVSGAVVFEPLGAVVDLAETWRGVAARILTMSVASDDRADLVSGKDAFLAPGVQNGAFRTEHDPREHRFARQPGENGRRERGFVADGGGPDPFEALVIEPGVNGVVVTRLPRLHPVGGVGRVGAVAGGRGKH